MHEPLTPKQEEFYRWLVRFQRKHGYFPTYQEVILGFGLRSKAHVKHFLDQLEAKGRLRRKPGSSRGMALVSRQFAIPYCGHVSAGKGIDFADVEQECIQLTADLVPPDEELFAVSVKGDSLVDALIGDGDLLLVARTPRVENGQLAVVRIPSRVFPDGETTCKRFFQRGSQVELRAENPAYAPLHLDASSVEVQGRVVGVVRTHWASGLARSA